tara:strand:- start:127 stop:480 length:354 start_codon:yes stop_codon:yes gene_type:complete
VLKISSLILITALIGCANLELSQAGRDVQLLTQLPSSNSKPFVEVGDISCDFGMNARSPSTNIIQCRNDLKNKAARLGAKIVVVQHQQLGTGGSGFGEYAIAGCPNCITMVGTAYTY